MLYHGKDPEKPRFRLLGPTRTSTVNIGGATIHSGFGIKPGTRLLDLNGKSKATFRNRLSHVKFLIIYEISLVSSDIHKSDGNYPKDPLHMLTENEPAKKRNEAVSDNCKYLFATV